MKVKNNNKGFTLIELIVVIAIMASILTLAITSLNGISKKKKQEAKKKVEDQIEVAAKEYFDSNEYLFEDLTVNSSKTIPLYQLISSDYLTTLTNPVTGKKYNSCDFVIVKRDKTNKYTFTYKAYSTGDNCGTNSSYAYTVPGTNKVRYLNINKSCVKTSDETVSVTGGKLYEIGLNWCLGQEKIEINASEDSEGKNKVTDELITLYVDKKGTTMSDDFEYADDIGNVFSSANGEFTINDKTSDASKKTYYVKSTYSSTYYDIFYAIDNISPTVELASSSSFVSDDESNVLWYNKSKSDFGYNAPQYTLNYSDSHSGIDAANSKYKRGREESTFDHDYPVSYLDENNKCVEGEYTDSYSVCDKAGNCTKKEIYAKIDITPPKINYKNIINAGTGGFDSISYTNKKATYTIEATDNVSIDTNHNFTSYIDSNSTLNTSPDITKNNKNGTNKNGLFYIEWLYSAKKDTSIDGTNVSCSTSGNWCILPDKIAYEIVSKGKIATDDIVECENEKKCVRTGGSLGAGAEANREQTYTVCDKAGNCATKSIYAKFDLTAPTITYNVTQGKASTENFDKAKWQNVTAYYNVTATDNLSGLNATNDFSEYKNGTKNTPLGNKTREKDNGTSGVFYVDWYEVKDKKINTNKIKYDIVSLCKKNGTDSDAYACNSTYNISACKNGDKICTRTKGGLGTGAEGKRQQTYTACDLAGNCTTASIYVKIDTTPPVINTITIPYKVTEYNTCNGNAYIYTKFSVTDNKKLYNVYHFLSQRFEHIDKDKKINSDSYKLYKALKASTGNYRSVRDGVSYKYNVMRKKASGSSITDDQIKAYTNENNENGYTIIRRWASTTCTNSKTASDCINNKCTSKYFCDSVGTDKPPLDKNYCNLILAEDEAGNEAYLRSCKSDISTNNDDATDNTNKWKTDSEK